MSDQATDGLREQPVADVVKQLSQDVSTLVRQELRLAQAELSEKGKQAGFGLGMFGGAGIAALLALGALTACLIAALATAMETWVAALIVTVLLAGVAAVLALLGRDRVTEAAPPVPEQTVETVKEDVQWAKSQLSSESR
jgi:uncharacterized membrane protein YqjE